MQEISTADDLGAPQPHSFALADLERKHDLLRTRVKGVFEGVYSSLYVHGPTGTGKSHIVNEQLRRLRDAEPGRAPHVGHKGHLTPLGLFDLIEEHADRVIVLDDVQMLFQQRVSQQLLLAALGSSDDGSRIVKYRRQGCQREVNFSGGIIAIANHDIRQGTTDPVLEALHSRAHVVRFAPTSEEMEALVRHLATQGWERETDDRPMSLSPSECQEVADFLIDECRLRSHRLDLRLFVDKSLPDFWHFTYGETYVDWHDLVLSSIEEQVIKPEFTAKPEFALSRNVRVEKEIGILAEILRKFDGTAERLEAWHEYTLRDKRSYYRRLEQLKEREDRGGEGRELAGLGRVEPEFGVLELAGRG